MEVSPREEITSTYCSEKVKKTEVQLGSTLLHVAGIDRSYVNICSFTK